MRELYHFLTKWLQDGADSATVLTSNRADEGAGGIKELQIAGRLGGGAATQ